MTLQLIFQIIVFVGIVGGVGVALGFVASRLVEKRRLDELARQSQRVLEEARREAEARKREAELMARQQFYKVRVEFDQETKDQRQELQQLEKRLVSREENIDRKADILDRKERELEEREQRLAQLEKELHDRTEELGRLAQKRDEELQHLAGLSREEARQIVLEAVREEGGISPVADETAPVETPSPLSFPTPGDSLAVAVDLPSDEMKGRVIGREGRNIRTLEMLTTTQVSLQDATRRTIVWSWDPLRREVARLSLEKLIADGKIFPRVIEEVVGRVKQQVEAQLLERAQAVLAMLGIVDLHPELVRLLGRLSFQNSFGQNVLIHSVEVAKKMAERAVPAGLDEKKALRIGLLHDIGKASGFDVKGFHAAAGAELIRKYGETEEIAQAIQAHHGPAVEEPYGKLLQECDRTRSVSAHLGEEAADYLQRVSRLKAVVTAVPKVLRAEHVDARWYIRLAVEIDKVEEGALPGLLNELNQKVQAESLLPKPIRLLVIQETRLVEPL